MRRETFEDQLKHLLDDLLAMGELVDQAIAQSLQALVQRDPALARQVIDADERINRAERDLEEKCLVFIASQTPLASDLRTAFSAAIIASNLERMADHAKNIARIFLQMADQPLLKPLVDIPRMAEKDRYMLREQLRAFVTRDAAAARRLAAEDDEVDQLYDQIDRELLIFMMQDPRTISRAAYLLQIAHALERIGDRTTNIGERTIFLMTGEIEELNVQRAGRNE